MRRFTTLLAALQKAKLVSNLKEGKTLSVFAPTDDAFAKLGVQLDALDPATLKKILLHHIVPGKVRANALQPLTKVKSLGGTHIATSDIKLVQSDVAAADGVLHHRMFRYNTILGLGATRIFFGLPKETNSLTWSNQSTGTIQPPYTISPTRCVINLNSSIHLDFRIRQNRLWNTFQKRITLTLFKLKFYLRM